MSPFNIKRVRDLVNLNKYHFVSSMIIGLMMVWLGVSKALVYLNNADRYLVLIVGNLYLLHTLYIMIRVMIVSYKYNKKTGRDQ